MRRALVVAAAALVLSACPDWDESHYQFKCSPAFPQDCSDGGLDGGQGFQLSSLNPTSIAWGTDTPVTAKATALLCSPNHPALSLELLSGETVGGPYPSTSCDANAGTFTVTVQPGSLAGSFNYNVRATNGDGAPSPNVAYLFIQAQPDGGGDGGTSGDGGTDSGAGGDSGFPGDAGADAGGSGDGGGGCGGPYLINSAGTRPSVAIGPDGAMVAFILAGGVALAPRNADLSANSFAVHNAGPAAVEVAAVALPPSSGYPFAVAYLDSASYDISLQWVDASGTFAAAVPQALYGGALARHVTLAAGPNGVGMAWYAPQTNGVEYAYDGFGTSGAWTLPTMSPGISSGNPTLAGPDSTGSFPIAIDGPASTVILDHVIPATGAETGGSSSPFDGGPSSIASDGTNEALAYLAGAVLPWVRVGTGPGQALNGSALTSVMPAIAGRPDGGFGFAIVYDGGIEFGVLDSAGNRIGGLYPGPATYDAPSTKLSVAWAGPKVLGWAADTDAGVMVGSICVP